MKRIIALLLVCSAGAALAQTTTATVTLPAQLQVVSSDNFPLIGVSDSFLALAHPTAFSGCDFGGGSSIGGVVVFPNNPSAWKNASAAPGSLNGVTTGLDKNIMSVVQWAVSTGKTLKIDYHPGNANKFCIARSIQTE